MARLFVDNWGWLALRDRGERRHKAAVSVFNGAQVTAGGIVTTDYVLDETFTLLFRRLAAPEALAAVEALLAAIDERSVSLAAITPARFAEAVKLRMKYRDRPEISFTDFTSMAVMRELKLTQVLTEDGHFAQVGLGFGLVP